MVNFNLVDTHCHLNIIVKKAFDIALSADEILLAKNIIDEAFLNNVTTIINVGTAYEESLNCIKLSQHYKNVFATIGIHPNDLNDNWKNELKKLENLIADPKNKIVGIGECGLDKHYPGYDLPKQIDAFKAQIELSLRHDLGLVVHTRDAADETLKVLEEYKNEIKRGIIHCFSENAEFARTVTSWGFCIGLGGIITYPKNQYLRDIAKEMPLEKIVLETDSPYLPPQVIRGKTNTPKEILTIANYLAELKGVSIETLAEKTTANAIRIFNPFGV